ncbi:hypothetical protein KEC57_01760 [Microbacterium sp. BWT-G7]|uniref:Uncharacterized protein n=1 Tax=Microbacterium allomyrinae TaxID=2830666 RepID=A0A9X1LSU7_9MICO|nr:hypothetical protein [Microbacterium allomyrinae]
MPALYDTFGKSWSLHNVGGSIATDVTLRLGFPIKKVGNPWKDFSIGQAVGPGQSVVIPNTDRLADPRVKMYPKQTPETPNGWATLKPGEERDDAIYVNDQYVTIHWRDHKGRERRGRIPVR